MIADYHGWLMVWSEQESIWKAISKSGVPGTFELAGGFTNREDFLKAVDIYRRRVRNRS